MWYSDTIHQNDIDLEIQNTKIDSLPVSEGVKSKIKNLLLAELSTRSVEIGGKKFSELKPLIDDQEVRIWPEWYEHVTYIKWRVIYREAINAGKSIFNNIEEAKAFFTKYVPWSTESERILNFVNMLWLEKSGTPNESRDDWLCLGERGYPWLTKPYKFKYANGNSAYVAESISFWNENEEAKFIRGEVEDRWSPVICFED